MVAQALNTKASNSRAALQEAGEGPKNYQDGLKLLQLGHWIRNYKSLRIFHPVISTVTGFWQLRNHRLWYTSKYWRMANPLVLVKLWNPTGPATGPQTRTGLHPGAYFFRFGGRPTGSQWGKSLVCSPLRLHSVSPKLPTSLLAMVKCISSKIAAFDTHKLKKSNMNNMFINQRKGSIVAFSSTSWFLILLPAHFAATEGLLLGLNLRCAQLRVGTISEKSRQNSTHLCRGQAFWCRDPCCLVRRAVLLGACSLASPSRAKDLCATTYTRLV